ncbi:hypothetical protein GCM10009730_41310 [Streptomyces albidochromogenes]
MNVPEAPKEQILPGISQAHVPHGRGHSGKQDGPGRARAGNKAQHLSRIPSSPTVKAGTILDVSDVRAVFR